MEFHKKGIHLMNRKITKAAKLLNKMKLSNMQPIEIEIDNAMECEEELLNIIEVPTNATAIIIGYL